MFEEKREELSTRVWGTSGDIAKIASANDVLIPHQRIYTRAFGHGCSSHPRHVVSSLPGRAALCTAATLVPSSERCFQLAEILHSMSVCSADRYRLKPSVFLTALCWRCNLLSLVGPTALLHFWCRFAPAVKRFGRKKAIFQRLCDKAEGGSHSRSMLVRSLL